MSQSPPLNEKISRALHQPWVIVILMALCLLPWVASRITELYSYQMPTSQTVHPNYYTFHDMSQSWLDGKKLGVIDINRMIINSHRMITSDYFTEELPNDKHCTYISLDPGFALIVTAARKLMTGLPDSYLRTAALQVICDGLMLFAIFLTFLRMGIVPAVTTSLVYALHPVFSYNTVFPFQYFWEGWLLGVAVLSVIWARRCSLGNRRIVAMLLIALAAASCGFALWVRSSALVVAGLLLISFLTVPSLRRYYGIFFLVFALTILPQVVRASSVAGHFALSTRMSWHTAFQALGRYPNRYGIEDEDLYVFTRTQNDYGIEYNYCDYSKHDQAARAEFMQMWHEDPGFVTRSILSRIMHNILFNYAKAGFDADSLFFVALALFGLLYGLLRRGEHLFITGLMSLAYLGYCVAVGLVYYMAEPYAYVAEWALLLMIPSAAAGITAALQNEFSTLTSVAKAHDWRFAKNAPMAKAVFIIIIAGVICMAGTMAFPPVRHYFFPIDAYQEGWTSFGAPNRDDNKKLVDNWKALPPATKQAFLDLVHKSIAATNDPEKDVARYITQNYNVIVYRDHADKNKEKVVFTLPALNADVTSVLKAISQSILGWDITYVSVINISDPESWARGKIHIKLAPVPERAGVDYQRLANEKFRRFNFTDVTWLEPNEVIARHNGHFCDALRAALAIYYRGTCPYDPKTGPSPLTPDLNQKIPTPAAGKT